MVGREGEVEVVAIKQPPDHSEVNDDRYCVEDPVTPAGPLRFVRIVVGIGVRIGPRLEQEVQEVDHQDQAHVNQEGFYLLQVWITCLGLEDNQDERGHAHLSEEVFAELPG